MYEKNRRVGWDAAAGAAAEETEGQLEGRNALQEALKSGRTADKGFIAAGEIDRGLQRLAAEAKEAGAVVVPVDRRKLDAMSFTHAHQGVIAQAAAHVYYSIDDILEEAASRGEAPLIVICDELSDPHNLGAILVLSLGCPYRFLPFSPGADAGPHKAEWRRRQRHSGS